MSSRTNIQQLLDLVERYNLHHVKTLPYNHVRSALEWLGAQPSDIPSGCEEEDTVKVLNRFVRERGLGHVQVMDIDGTPQLQGKERLVVHIKQREKPRSRDAIVLFLVMKCVTKVPYSAEHNMLLCRANSFVSREIPLFPTLATCPPHPDFEACAQQPHPVIDGFLPKSYEMTIPNAPAVTEHNNLFGEKYEPLQPTAEPARWSIYADIAQPPGSEHGEIDIEKLIVTPNTVLGRGGFGVTVPIDDKLVAKTALFPDMVNWSLPFIDNKFNRYAHVASQLEEIMLGVSMRHPNILRTFGGFWCDIPGYQLGGRAVLIMERALYSLQEFAYRIKSKAVVPVVELDTLKGLEYLRSRTIQHRDFTYRNVLVCHQPDRKPLPFAFKISDFGTSCNFSTPDQPRGNRTNMAPEVLWCLNTATGSDIFSWYCVMWELHGDSSLIGYKGPRGKSYCKSTYAENLSELVGVYNPARSEAFELKHMVAMNARELHAKHKNARPSARDILAKLQRMGRGIADSYFVSMGVLCITLYPQERWSPSELLNLPRYQRLTEDVSEAELTPSRRIPSSVRVGEYRPTDIVACEDCVPEELAKLTTDGAASPVKVIDARDKVHYGIDLLRLAPDRIEPYEWYSKKVGELNDRSEFCKKRKADAADDPVERRRPKTAAAHAAEDLGEGALRRRDFSLARHPLPPLGSSAPRLPNVEHELPCVLQSGDVRAGFKSVQKTPGARPDLGAHVLTREVSLPQPQDRSTADRAGETARDPQSTVILRGRKIEGELDTTIAILMSRDANEIAHFKQNVICLSQNMTRLHPAIFTGPRDELSKCSGSKGALIFQYARSSEECKQVAKWTESDSPHSVYAFLLQVFLTLETALNAKVLPTHMSEWTDMLISKGAVTIDVVSYLSKNYTKPRCSMFGEKCESLPGLCAALVTKHLPDSELRRLLSGLKSETSARRVLTDSIEWLRLFARGERAVAHLAPLNNSVVTFKDYASNVSNWLTNTGEESPRTRSDAHMLVYGYPKPFRGNQMAESTGDTNLNTLVRNLILRMKVKVFESLRLKVSALDCTRGLTKVTLYNSALSGVTGVDQLKRSSKIGARVTHDVVSQTESKWGPVVMFEKCSRQGPVEELTVEFYKVTILVVLLSPEGSVKSLRELFQGVTTFSESDY